MNAWQRAGGFGLSALLIAMSCGPLACASQSSKAPSAPTSVPSLHPVPTRPFAFRAIDGREISSEAALGRVSVLTFITTYDLPSQAQARFLSALAHDHVPRVNCFAVVLESQESSLLVEAFVNALRLTYPVALVQPPLPKDGAFSEVHSVPSVWVLDRAGRVVWQKPSLVTQQELEEVLRAAEALP